MFPGIRRILIKLPGIMVVIVITGMKRSVCRIVQAGLFRDKSAKAGQENLVMGFTFITKEIVLFMSPDLVRLLLYPG